MNSFTNGKLVDAVAGEYLPVRIVDPSLFTIAYDEALVTALRAEGCAAVLHARASRPGEMPPAVPFEAGFYRRFDDAPRRLGGVGAALKAAEHVRERPRPRRRGAGRRGHPLPVAALSRSPTPASSAASAAAGRSSSPSTTPGPSTARRPRGVQRWGFAAALAAADRLIVHTEAGRGRLAELGLAPGAHPRHPARAARRRPPARAAGPTPGASPSSPSARCAPTRVSTSSPPPSAASTPAIAPALRVIVAGEPMMDLARAPRHRRRRRPRRHRRDRAAPPRRGRDGAALRARRRLRLPLPRDRGERGLLPRPGPRPLGDRLAASAPSPRRSRTASRAASCRPDDVAALAAALVECVERRPSPSAPARVTDWATIARATLATYAEARAEWAGRRGAA